MKKKNVVFDVKEFTFETFFFFFFYLGQTGNMFNLWWEEVCDVTVTSFMMISLWALNSASTRLHTEFCSRQMRERQTWSRCKVPFYNQNRTQPTSSWRPELINYTDLLCSNHLATRFRSPTLRLDPHTHACSSNNTKHAGSFTGWTKGAADRRTGAPAGTNRREQPDWQDAAAGSASPATHLLWLLMLIIDPVKVIKTDLRSEN